MDLFFAIGNVGMGMMMTMIGFKVYNPWKGNKEDKKEALWYKKFGTFFKIAGIALLIFGIIKTIENL